MRDLKKRTGFSLIEVMIVVASLSIAAAIFAPRYLRHKRALEQKTAVPAETQPSGQE